MDDEDYIRRRIWVRSTPGFMAQYDGYVDVWMRRNDEDYLGAAVRELGREAFSDRKSRSLWIFERMEEL